MGIVLSVTNLDIWVLFVCDRSRYMGIVLSVKHIKIYRDCFVSDRSRFMGIVLSVTYQDISGLFCL